MNFKRENTKDLYLHDTLVENIFLMEYMPGADGEAIKVYFTALMYANDPEMSNTLIARHLGITEEDVLRAWNYWEHCGIVRKIYHDPSDRFHYTVKFLNIKDRLYGGVFDITEQGSDKTDSLPEEMDDRMVKEIFDVIQQLIGRMFEGSEARKIISWIYDDRIEPELIVYAYKYSLKRDKNNFKYVSAVLGGWVGDGLYTVEEVKAHLSETNERYHKYKKEIGRAHV